MRLADKMNAGGLREARRAIVPLARLRAGLQLTEHQPRSRDNNRLSCGCLLTARSFLRVASTPCQPLLSRAALRRKLGFVCLDAAVGLVRSLRPSLVRRFKAQRASLWKERGGTETPTKLEAP